jgi:hypothetical protein
MKFLKSLFLRDPKKFNTDLLRTARAELVYYQAAAEYSQKMIELHTDRIARLTEAGA